MLEKQSLPAIKKVCFIGFSALLIGTGGFNLLPKASASPGFFEYQWNPEEGYKQLKYYQTSTGRGDRASYYFFLRGRDRKKDIIKLTLTVPDYFKAKIKTKNLSLCKVNRGGYTSRTRCLENVPSLIKVNDKQTSIEIFPERPIPLNKDNYAVLMKVFNPLKRGMFQFRALSQQADEIPISTYLGTWNIQVQ